LEFGGSRSQSITLTAQHVNTLAEHLPELYDAVYLGKRYSYKDGEFKLQCSGTDSVARLYLNKRFVTLKDCDIRYLTGMLHLVQTQQTQYTLAREDVVAYVLLAQAASEFVEPRSALCGLIL
jgi:hypothetical protein